MEGQKTGTFGARILHEKEIELSLPTYNKLKSQIEDVRTNSKNYKNEIKGNKRDEFTYSQVINNFAILGERGTGKSSILKTLYQDLKNQNESDKELKKIKNIMLPPIVPENLVSHISLMGCLLGLLKEPVRQICENQENKKPLCPPEKHNIEKLYKSLVEDFVRLQKPYEQISVREFSTDSEYVRTMTSIYEAGNQFAIKFREFIDELLAQYNDEAMLFIFIDDIDLSTIRCGDIVKTLLSYLSHPSIVTVLAGDIAVFGEALTIEFVRQEEITDAEFMRRSYLIESVDKKTSTGEDDKDNLLKRKKQLAYEYLKKVMPPNNRHHILYWTLSMRGDFCCIDTQSSESKNKEDESDSLTLTDLLVQLDTKIPLLNYYFSEKTQGNVNKDRKLDVLLYHFFDSTARGLNSSYNAIKQMLKNCEEDKSPKYQDIKFVIETIVSSNYILSQYRDIIFSQFIEFGTDIESTRVNFDNFSNWVLDKIDYLEEFETNKQSKEAREKFYKLDKIINLNLEEIAFKIFVFLDWSARMLSKEEDIDNNIYNKIKEKMLFLLLSNGYINEKNMVLTAEQRCKIHLSKLINTKEDIGLVLKIYYNLKFPIAVRYFQKLNNANFINQIITTTYYDKDKKIMKNIADFINTLNAFYHNDISSVGECLNRNEDLIKFINKNFQNDRNNRILFTTVNDYFRYNSVFYKYYWLSGCKSICFYNDGSYLPRFDFDVDINANEYLVSTSKVMHTDIFHNKRLSHLLENLDIESENIDEDIKYSGMEREIYYNWKEFIDSKHVEPILLEPFYNAYTQYMQGNVINNGIISKLGKNYKNSVSQQIEIIYAIDKNDAWNIDDGWLTEESHIECVRKYVYNQLKVIEEKLAKQFKFSVDRKSSIKVNLSNDLIKSVKI